MGGLEGDDVDDGRTYATSGSGPKRRKRWHVRAFPVLGGLIRDLYVVEDRNPDRLKADVGEVEDLGAETQPS